MLSMIKSHFCNNYSESTRAQKLKKLKKIDAYIKSNWSNSLKQELASIELKCVPKRQGATIPCPDCASLKQFLLNQVHNGHI